MIKYKNISKNDEEAKKFKFITDNKVYCNCGDGHHGVVFYDNKTDRKLCVNCGHWIYRDPQTKLKYEMKERGVRVGNL